MGINTSNQFCNHEVDIIDSKIHTSKRAPLRETHKYICIVKFDNQNLEAIRLPKIYNYPDVIKALPDNLQEKQNFPTVTSYQLESSISNNILIYKDALNSA